MTNSKGGMARFVLKACSLHAPVVNSGASSTE